MTDFLTRLAQRSIGAAPLIAPRLPSLFASDDGAAPVNAANTDITQHTPRAAAPATAPMPAAGARRTDPVVTELHTSIDAPQRSPAPEASPAPATAPQTARTPPHIEPIPLVKPSQPDMQAAQPPAAIAPRTEVSPTPHVTQLVQQTATAQQPWQPLLPQRAAQPAAAFPALADAAANNNATASAPTVNITIGRVEVRANVAAPQPAPRPRPTSVPALSLSDFLKRGAGAS